MSRDRTRTRERATEEDDAPEFDRRRARGGTASGSTTAGTSEEGLVGRVRARADRVFAPRPFLVALVGSVVGLAVGTAVVPLPGAGLLGVFLAAFVFGLLRARRRYLEATLAGGLTVGAAALLGYGVVGVLAGVGLPVGAVMGGVGAIVGAAGHYFGRDLRDGLTREL